MTKIILNEEVGPNFVNVITQSCIDLEVNAVIISANLPEDILPKGMVGSFTPHTKNIAIDLARIMRDNSLRMKGMMFLPSMWYNLLWTFYHELTHAIQLEEDPSLIKYETLPIELEKDAEEGALLNLQDWTRRNDAPRIEHMGWLGVEMSKYVNKMYSINPRAADELDWMHMGAVMNVLDLIELGDLGDDGKLELMELMDKPDNGVHMDGESFITAQVFFDQYLMLRNRIYARDYSRKAQAYMKNVHGHLH
jgi:hypothetical protein